MELIFFSLVVIVISALYLRFIKKYSYWKERNIKSLPVSPIVGSYVGLMFAKEHHGQYFRKIYEQYPNEKYIGSFRGSTPELMVRDPEVIRCIISKDFNHFMDRGIRQNVSEDDILAQHLFHMPGEKWKALRQKMTPTFTSSKMKKMFHLLVECGEVLDASVKEKLLDSNEVDVKELNAKFTTDTIGSCAFGLQMNSLKDDDSPFRKMGRKFFDTSRKDILLRFFAGVFPVFFQIFNIKVHSHQEEIQNFFLSLVKSLISTRSGVAQRHDFVDLMLELREKGSIEFKNTDDSRNNKLEITDELLTAQLFVFFVAGFETSSTTMSYALREQALNPDAQKKLQHEIDVVIKKHGGVLTYDSIYEMEYLDMVIDETLRKYPPAANLNRICTIPYKLPDTDITIDKGVKILIPTYGIHHDAIHFPDPEKFIPERFSKENGNTHHQFAYMPFGEGPRICIGLRFGKLQTAVGLISFMRKYSVEPCSRTQIKLKLDPNAVVLSSEGGVILRITPRS